MKKLFLIILIIFSTSCSKSGLTIGEEVNYLGSFATYLYLGFTNPDSLPDKVSESLEKWVTSLVENDNNDEVISKKNISLFFLSSKKNSSKSTNVRPAGRIALA